MKRLLWIFALSCSLLPASIARAGVLTFQQGVGGYIGTADTAIRYSNDPDTNYGNAQEISIDSDDGPGNLNPTQGLIRFNDIFCAGPGKIPFGAIIESATLTLRITSGGSGIIFHRMLIDWDEMTATWNTFAPGVNGGVQADGIQALATPTLSVGANNGSSNIPGNSTQVFNLTADVQAWSNGSANFGWALLPFMPLGTNGVDFWSRDAADISVRPILSVQFRVIPEPATLTSLGIGGLVLLVGSFFRRRTV
jgi:hypothetical protein